MSTKSSISVSTTDLTKPLPLAFAADVVARFESAARGAPETLAVQDPLEACTYDELRLRSNGVARLCRERNAGPNAIVAIRADRSVGTVAAMLGILKAGACFVTIDAGEPTPHVLGQLRAANPALVVDTSPTPLPVELGQHLSGRPVLVMAPGRDDAIAVAPSSEAPELDLGVDARAYAVFTSGTTGTPKAIAATRTALAHFIDWELNTFEIGPRDRFSGLAGIGHAVFVRDVFAPLCAGATLHLPPDSLRAETKELAAWLIAHGVTVTHLTPSRGELLAYAKGMEVGTLRYVLFASEPLKGELLERLSRVTPNARFVNLYGATETPQAISFFPVDRIEPGIVPVGRGIDGVELLVMTDSGKVAAVDELGEIYVRSPYLASTYLNGAPGGFMTNPLRDDPMDRMYRTGDLGCFLADGNVAFRGRADNQVKVRGHRVELDDVERRIQKMEGVSQCVVTVGRDGASLVAHVVGDVTARGLLADLRKELPDYMVPNSVSLCRALPLTANGKIDRKALASGKKLP